MELISCITPTFNRCESLENAIKSCLNQTYPNWEMIIVDDGSKDDTKKLVNRYIEKDKRIKYFKNSGKGASSARNLGIMNSTGSWVAFLDDDDENLPHRFESQLSAAIKNNKNFILSGYIVITESGREKVVNKGLWGQGAGIGCRWFIKKELLIKAGLFDETMPSMQEVELSYRISKFEVFANHFDVVTKVHLSENSISRGSNGLMGKKLLIEKHQHIMHPFEAAWWYFVIAMDYYRLDDISNALKYLKIASETNKNTAMDLAYQYARKFIALGGPFKILNRKIFKMLGNRFPKLVEHPVV